MTCIPDADMGTTTTSPLNPDTDYGGVKDGVEDANHNGTIDNGETDPNDPGDDMPCAMDSDCPSGKICDTSKGVCVDGCAKDNDCGGPMSGKVCDGTTHMCGDGCRGTNGNGCPDPKVCTSKDDTIGMCVDCLTDSDCGGPMSGKVCDDTTHTCGDGCRGTGGNTCPSGQKCSSMDITQGACSPIPEGGVIAEGNGILCSARPANDNGSDLGFMLGGALGLLAAARRRRRR